MKENINPFGTGWNLDNSYSKLPDIFYTEQKPTPVRRPELVMFNNALAESIGLDPVQLNNPKAAEIFAGNQIPEGSVPIAQAYAGHQFEHFTMLGDGRALLLGEQITPEGKRLDIQLKGSGRTAYSRGGDGKAALGPMLREYLISEAMYGLGIPTTRSLAVATTGESVIREMPLPGAVLTRVASSHIRVGTFQFVSKWGTDEELKALADYTWERHFSDIDEGENRYLAMLKEVIRRQAELIAAWQLVGFIHGVMNTDNMVICGETIDYGPCAFMDVYDPSTVFSSIDARGRYAYGNQSGIAEWNLSRFAETLLPLISDDHHQAKVLAMEALVEYHRLFERCWLAGMRAKLGIFHEELQDEKLIGELLEIMRKNQADFTNMFRVLTLDRPEESELYEKEEFLRWLTSWQSRLERQDETKEDSIKLMREYNPAIIPRNHRVEEALDAAVKQGDYEVMKRLLHVLSKPFAYTAEQDEYATPPKPSSSPYRTFCGT